MLPLDRVAVVFRRSPDRLDRLRLSIVGRVRDHILEVVDESFRTVRRLDDHPSVFFSHVDLGSGDESTSVSNIMEDRSAPSNLRWAYPSSQHKR